jgi:regulator of sirC expression with transglutaminase-like and TPR domain
MQLVPSYEYPDLTSEKLQAQLDALYGEVTAAYIPSDDPHEKVKGLNDVFFGKMGFAANIRHFHAPENSFLNVVLEKKMGMPITLCVLYLLAGNQLHLPLYGVNLPNLFVLTYKTPETQFYVNVFNKGNIFGKEDIDNYIAQLEMPTADVFYQPCTHLNIMARVLRNLVIAYERLGENQKMEDMKSLLAVLDSPRGQ